MKLLKNLSVKDCIGLHSAVVSYKVTDCFLRISHLESFSYGRFQGGSWGDRQVRNSCSLPCGLEIPNPDPQQWLKQKANGSLPSLGRSQAEVIQKKLAPCITELRSGAARPASGDLGYSQREHLISSFISGAQPPPSCSAPALWDVTFPGQGPLASALGMFVCVSSCSVVSDSLQPHGL